MYVVIYALPSRSGTLAVRVNRLLRRIGAEKLQRSVWRSENLRELTRVSLWIENAGGKATILEERRVY